MVSLRYGDLMMRGFRLYLIFVGILLHSFGMSSGLKCRSAAESQQSNDFEYVVRMCLRRMRNESDIFDFYKMQTDYDSGRNNRQRDEMSGDNSNNNDNRNYYNRNRGYPEGFDRFWPSNGPQRDRNRYGSAGEDDRNRQENEYEESDYFGLPRHGKEGRKRYKGRPQVPHSYQQQMQHDHDAYGRGNRDSNYFYANRNKNSKVFFTKEMNGDSPLADIDACVIYCIFQEMQLVDENGRPNKGSISQRMTQKIRNSELKNFIQESVEECFDAIDDEDFGYSYSGNNNNNNNNGNNRYRKQEMMSCEWAKTFAMCLENRGRDNCDDWNDPLQRNHGNNNNNNNSGNSKNNEDQNRHKPKQNDRG